jgi:ribosomal protein L28
VHILTPFGANEYFNLDVSAKDRKGKKDFNPNMMTDAGTSTGEYTICWVVMQLTSFCR